MTSAIRFLDVSRHYGAVKAVDGVNLDIQSGEFFVLLGPSGSGKTTCLRLMAGFERPDGGSIEILGEKTDDVPPYRRPVNTVFQDYALFPHLSVLDNVAYGLMVKGYKRRERHDRAMTALSQVRLPDLESRKPSELSGGQRQRVALARALVNEPRVLLLDEPLGALDLKLREQMQQELKTLQADLGITFVFVTHDQGEALSMADRIAIFNNGTIVQLGSPDQIYHQPVSAFVADFVGSSNILPAAIVQRITGEKYNASVRPEAIRVVQTNVDEVEPLEVSDDTVYVNTRVTTNSFQGASHRLTLQFDEHTITAQLPGDASVPPPGSRVRASWPLARMHVMAGEY